MGLNAIRGRVFFQKLSFSSATRSIEELKAIITEEFNAIPQEMIAKACRSVLERVAFCRHIGGEAFKNYEVDKELYTRKHRRNRDFALTYIPLLVTVSRLGHLTLKKTRPRIALSPTFSWYYLF